MELDAKLEAYLFYKGEPEDIKKLALFFETDEETVRSALRALDERLSHGVRLVTHDDNVALVTHSDAADVIEKLRKEEVSRDLGKAGLETLSIVLYKGPVTRSEIDYIRGVNSSYILRNLMIRGLIEKKSAGKGASQYVTTLELLTHLGVSNIEEMPQYHNIQQELLQKTDQHE